MKSNFRLVFVSSKPEIAKVRKTRDLASIIDPLGEILPRK